MTPEVAITEGGEDDLAEVIALMRRAFDPRFGEAWNLAQTLSVLAMPGSRLLLARGQRGLLGFALTRTLLDECELMLLAVEPRARRLGIARLLLVTMTRLARSENVKRLHLEVRQGNNAEQLYQSGGFLLVGHRPRYYRGPDGTMFDARTYARELD